MRDLFGVCSVPSARAVNPARLEVGDTVSFIYYRGARMGVKRTVTLVQKRGM